MKKAYLYVIKRALAEGHTVSVWDSEDMEWLCENSTSYQECKDHIESMDWTNFQIRPAGKGAEENIGTFAVVLEHGQPPEETINDYTITDWSEKVMDEYYATEEEA
jgi:hypothetical protein